MIPRSSSSSGFRQGFPTIQTFSDFREVFEIGELQERRGKFVGRVRGKSDEINGVRQEAIDWLREKTPGMV